MHEDESGPLYLPSVSALALEEMRGTTISICSIDQKHGHDLTEVRKLGRIGAFSAVNWTAMAASDSDQCMQMLTTVILSTAD